MVDANSSTTPFAAKSKSLNRGATNKSSASFSVRRTARDGLTVVAANTIEARCGDTVWLTIDDTLVHGFDSQSGDCIDEIDRGFRTRASETAVERSSKTD